MPPVLSVATTRRLLLVGWIVSMAVVSALSLKPNLELPLNFSNADKVYHFLGYAWLGGLPIGAFANRMRGRVLSLSMMLLGCLLEWGQSFVPGREASWGDAAANSAGVLLGLWLAEKVLARLTATDERDVS